MQSYLQVSTQICLIFSVSIKDLFAKLSFFSYQPFDFSAFFHHYQYLFWANCLTYQSGLESLKFLQCYLQFYLILQICYPFSIFYSLLASSQSLLILTFYPDFLMIFRRIQKLLAYALDLIHFSLLQIFQYRNLLKQQLSFKQKSFSDLFCPYFICLSIKIQNFSFPFLYQFCPIFKAYFSYLLFTKFSQMIYLYSSVMLISLFLIGAYYSDLIQVLICHLAEFYLKKLLMIVLFLFIFNQFQNGHFSWVSMFISSPLNHLNFIVWQVYLMAFQFWLFEVYQL